MTESKIVSHYGAIIHHEYNACDLALKGGDDWTAVGSRGAVQRDVTLTPKHGHDPISILPLWCANIHFANLSLAEALTHWECPYVTDPAARVQIALHKEIPAKDLADFIIKNGTSSAWMSIGVSTENRQRDLQKLRAVFDRVRDESNYALDKIVIDASNGHMDAMRQRLGDVRDIVDDTAIILAGNVVTGEITRKLIQAGADGAKINHGPAKVCNTRIVAGVTRPTFTAAIECANAAHEEGGFVVSDGGSTGQSGTSAVLFAAGVDGIMSGGLFAGHKECGEPFFRNWNPLDRKEVDFLKKYMWYFGSASMDALNKYHGGRDSHRPSEGGRRKVPYKPSLDETLTQWFGGVASAVSFQADLPSTEQDQNGKDVWRFYHLRQAKDRLVWAPQR